MSIVTVMLFIIGAVIVIAICWAIFQRLMPMVPPPFQNVAWILLLVVLLILAVWFFFGGGLASLGVGDGGIRSVR